MADKERPNDRGKNVGKTARFGFMMLGVAVLLVIAPFALFLQPLTKYFAAFAFLGMCLGMLCLLLATIEWLQSRR